MLRHTISSWYNALRNICIVLMLSVLVYIGIRMLLTTVAQEKAKYVDMLKDWFVGLCLLFVMHYIMAFSVTLVNKLTDVVKTSVGAQGYVEVLQDKDGEDGKLCEAVKQLGYEETISTGANGSAFVSWPTNLMGSLRLKLQMEDYGAQYIGYGICFIVLCLFTLYFTIIYAKRLLHMAFLTLIAPMVALTYCIDKINDGQAQGFNKWLKEYIFNLLIQPMHLLLYYILVTSAFELAGKNIIYSLVALGFMIPAEKLLRSLFGFEKASTAPALGPAGAMMAASAINSLIKGNNKGGKNGKGDGNENEEDTGRIRGSNAQDPIGPWAGEGNDGEQVNMPTTGEQAENEQAENTQEGNGQEINQQEVNEQSEQADGEQQNINDNYDGYNQWESYDPNSDLSYAEQMEQRQQRREAMKSEETEKPKTKIKKPTSAFRRAFKANWEAQKAAIATAPSAAMKKMAQMHPVKRLGKVAAGAALAGAALPVATAAAISSGDATNIIKGGLATGAAAYSVGSGNASNVKSAMENAEIKGIYSDTYNGPDYDEQALETYITQYLNNARNRNYFKQRNNNNKEEVDKMFERGGEIEKYLNNNISSMKEMQALHELMQDRNSGVNNIEQAISIQQFAKMIGSDTNAMNGKTREDWVKRMEKMATKNGTIKNPKGFAEQKLEQIDKFYDIKDKL